MIDSVDRKLLQLLQCDSQMTAQELSEHLHLSPSQVGRRRQRLETDGIIDGYAARLDAERLGLTVQAFVQVQLAKHGADSSRALALLLNQQPEIASAWTMTGEADYLLRVVCKDLKALNALIQEVLLAHDVVARVQSQIIMEEIKKEGPLPI